MFGQNITGLPLGQEKMMVMMLSVKIHEFSRTLGPRAAKLIAENEMSKI